MTVCVTGDVHHMGLETREQSYLDRSELDCAEAYVEIAASHGVPVTLFVTGKLAAEDPGRVGRLAAREGVAVGGHTYYAYGTPVHSVLRALSGSWHGPRRVQAWEIGRTLAALADAGIDVRAWRDHAYRNDAHTPELLAGRGITHFSDAVGPDEAVREEDGLTIVPINTPPDHEHLYHAFRTREFVAGNDFEGPFGADSYEVDEWLDRVLDHVERHRRAGRTATVLAHPACMELADGLAAFERLCEAVAGMDPGVVTEV